MGGFIFGILRYAKSTWKLLNGLTHLLTVRKAFDSQISNEEEIVHPTLIANRLCEYFTNIRSNLA